MTRAALSLLLVIGLTGSALAAVPPQLPIQGRLTNSGNALNGSHPAVFRLYDAPTGGNLLWTEGQTLQLENGLFSALLGQTTTLPVSLFAGQTLWLETEADATVLTPRQPLVSVAYSFRAQRSDTASVALSGATGNEVWATDGTNVWRTQGKVGIGTSTPIAALDVLGQAKIGGLGFIDDWPEVMWNAYYDGANTVYYANHPAFRVLNDFSSGLLRMSTSTGGLPGAQVNWQNGLILRPDNSVSIGTDSHEGPLTVYGTPLSPANMVVLRNTAPGGGPMTFSIGATGANLPAGMYGIGDENDTRLTINRNSGNVGIGTSSPDQKLRLNGMMGFGPTTWTQPSTRGMFLYHAGAGGGNLYAYDYTAGQGDPIGMSGSKVVLATYNSSGAFDGAKVTVLGNGNVGVGTENPTFKLHVVGDLCVTGMKNRLVSTKYGDLRLNANESAYAWFSTEGEARLTNGRARINLDPTFLATVTINSANPLRAYVTFYGPHGAFYVERDATGFTVVDRSGGQAPFSWKIEAKQKGYENTYLEPVERTAAVQGR